jgi:TetR/AcrR family transcriptional regulator, transcriptional repressor for nem operon
MPYSREHKTNSRERILSSALRLFSEGGFERVTLDQVMADAGFTRGAFYAHFTSKEDLYAKAIRHGINSSVLANIPPEGEGLRSLRRLLNAYLSRAHVDGNAPPCPLAFFATDVAVRERQVRDTYTAALQSLTGVLGSHAPARTHDERLLAMMILMVGGVAVSSALTDGALKDRILASCRKAILNMAAPNNLRPVRTPVTSKRARQKVTSARAASLR